MGKIKESLSLQLFILIFSLLFVVGMSVYGMVYFSVPAIFENYLSNEIEEAFEELVENVGDQHLERFESEILDFCQTYHTLIEVVNERHEVVYECSYLRQEDGLGTNMQTLTLTKGITIHDQNLFVFLMAPVQTSQVRNSFLSVLPIIIVINFLSATFGALLAHNRIAKPILEISKASKQMTDLDFKWECSINRKDELGILVENMSVMCERLNITMGKLQSANILLQEDIEKEKQRQQQERDFFAAVSHELKTPITSLACILDGMLLNIGRYKDRDKYLQSAKEINKMMADLVQEILIISKMDSQDFILEVQQVNLSEVVHSCCLQMEELSHSKEQKLVMEIQPGLSISANSNLIKKAVSNIIGNGICHSPAGETVSVKLFQTHSFIQLMVENTGTQIDEENQKNLFSPFYRVEKSRNRESGGSGLGLYLVGTILSRHQFSYHIFNRGNSVIFVVKFG